VLALNCRVILRTFNGTQITPADCRPDENYWALLGEHGTVVETINARARVLIKFDRTVSELGLHCHNAISNGLYILETDLEKIS